MATGIGGEAGWWCPSLDDAGNGTTTLNDLSGNANGGTLTNMTPATDWVADTGAGGVRALDFDGTDDFVAIGPGVWNSTGPITYCFWNFTVGGHQRGSGGRGDTTSDRLSVHAPWTDDRIYWDYGDILNGRLAYLGYDANGFGSKWTHICVQSNGLPSSGMAIFLDGVSVASKTKSDGPTGVIDFNIGVFNSTNYHLGRIDDVRLFSRILTPSEITLLASKRGYQPVTAIRSPLQSHVLGGYAGPLRGTV